MDGVLAIVMAGGMGERLQPLTRMRSKASVPFAGKYRLIDITLSNCINSGIRRVFVLTQYLSESLNRHIQEGWSISSSGLGDFIYCIPAQQKMGEVWYRGTADAVRQNLNLIKSKDVDNVLVLSGDHIYKMDYSRFLQYHVLHDVGMTIAAIRTRKDLAAGRLGVLEVAEDYKMLGFEEKPASPKTLPGNPDLTLSSMGIYSFQTEKLLHALEGEGQDFGKNIIPAMLSAGESIYVYDYEKENRISDFEIRVENGVREKVLVGRMRDSGYWRDVGTIDSYYESSLDLLAIDPLFSLYGEKWPLRTFQRQVPPSKCTLGGRIVDSIISDGCIVSGSSVERCIVSPGAIFERGAVIEDSVIFDDVLIEPGAYIKRAIIDKECRIRAGVSLGHDLESDKRHGCTVSPGGVVVVPKGMEIKG
jgi:glucose-1-phosphate adenylyltransferase